MLSVRPRPHLATTEAANTSLNLQLSRVFKRHVADIRFAIVRIVNTPRPLPRALRPHADEKLQPHDRASRVPWIWILVVNLLFSRRAINRRLKPNDSATQRGAASTYCYLGVSSLGQPDPDGSSALEATAPEATKRRKIPDTKSRFILAPERKFLLLPTRINAVLHSCSLIWLRESIPRGEG